MKKIGLIILIVVVALGVMGAAYAAWQQTLNISGTVGTATFNVSMSYDNSTGPQKPTDADNTTFTVTTDTSAKASYNAGNSGLTVTITEAVPGVYTIPGVYVTNNSTIPLDLSVGTVTGTDLTLTGTQIDDSAFKTAATLDPLAAGASTTAKDIKITIDDSVTQGTSLTFIIPVTANQS